MVWYHTAGSLFPVASCIICGTIPVRTRFPPTGFHRKRGGLFQCWWRRVEGNVATRFRDLRVRLLYSNQLPVRSCFFIFHPSQRTSCFFSLPSSPSLLLSFRLISHVLCPQASPLDLDRGRTRETKLRRQCHTTKEAHFEVVPLPAVTPASPRPSAETEKGRAAGWRMD